MGSGRRTPVACGIDAGSTNLKVVLVADGEVVARASRPTPLDRATSTIDVRRHLLDLEELVLGACGSAYAVSSVCAAGTGEDGFLVDADLEPLGPCLAWHAPSRVPLIEELRASLVDVEDLPVATDAARTLVGWWWSRRQLAEDRRVGAWLALTDHAAIRWSGTPFLSDSLAARTAAWRSTDHAWVEPRVRHVLGDLALLPPVVRGGSVVGPLTSARLHEVATPDAVVVAGGHDHPVGAWGVRRVAPRAVLDSMGTAEVVVAAARAPGQRRTPDVDVAPAFPGDQGDTVLQVEELDRNVRWASSHPDVALALADLLAGRTEPDRWSESTVFVPGARAGGAPRFTDGAPLAPVSRASAVLGALARVGAGAVAELGALVGDDPVVYAAGGWSRSSGWMRLKERYGPIGRLVEPEVTAVGAAALGSVETGDPWSVAQALGAS